ncbi:uncharacterized protein LOC142986726 [Anticarsia gemmatalis]|uniref:uncharacterized protein LOC142986726 n=1 Tax=Anticarsia gemmatalis TaxID=129554 RepID=UPI003F768CEC
MSRSFDFKLIKTVEPFPCLWNDRCREYKNKTLRLEAWERVCAQMDDGYSYLPRNAQLEMIASMKTKWLIIKNIYVNILKITYVMEPLKYKYLQNLKFLDVTDEVRNIQVVDVDDGDSSTASAEEYRKLLHADQTPKPDPKYREEKLFFHSFLPYVRNMTETDKLNFHKYMLIAVTKIMDGTADEEMTTRSTGTSPIPETSGMASISQDMASTSRDMASTSRDLPSTSGYVGESRPSTSSASTSQEIPDNDTEILLLSPDEGREESPPCKIIKVDDNKTKVQPKDTSEVKVTKD